MIELGEKHEYAFGGGWSRLVQVDGVEYRVGVERGKMVRIAFKPRGKNRGWKWHGFVRDPKTNKTIWGGEVGKSLGARGLLRAAGLLKKEA
jgi:hypothetical protein